MLELSVSGECAEVDWLIMCCLVLDQLRVTGNWVEFSDCLKGTREAGNRV